MKNFNIIKNFLENSENIDSIIKSDALIWIDWREYDEDIISYVNEKIEDKVEVEFISNDKAYGDDICLKYPDQSLIVPYREVMDRDTTIKYLNEFIQPKYEIRFFMESLGSDTLAFAVLPEDLWRTLEAAFGLDKVHFYFEKIELDSKMFDLDMDEIFELMNKRKGLSF